MYGVVKRYSIMPYDCQKKDVFNHILLFVISRLSTNVINAIMIEMVLLPPQERRAVEQTSAYNLLLPCCGVPQVLCRAVSSLLEMVSFVSFVFVVSKN